MKEYKTIYADPPYPQKIIGKFAERNRRALELPYNTMSIEEICNLPINELADKECHLWIWTTNQFLHDTFHIIEKWGFKYLQTITWIKPSGCGAYFVNTTQHLLFAYKEKCIFKRGRFKPTHFKTSIPKGHSVKPTQVYTMIEDISEEPRLELFARNRREGWDVFGNEIPKDTQRLITKMGGNFTPNGVVELGLNGSATAPPKDFSSTEKSFV